jgi:DNA-binding NtrC family response regulator
MIKVLVVDDETDITDTFVNSLRSSNYDSYGAKNSKEALKALDNKPHIIVLDLNLREEITGIEILKKAKELNPNVEVIVVTGLGDDSAVDEAIDWGAKIVLQKPTPVTKMLDSVNQLAKQFIQKEPAR